MRIGTPGFIGGRLTEGREARGLSQTCLAELTGIKSQSISHYEQCRQSPSPEALALLCDKLQVPERFFLRPILTAAENPVVFRAHALLSRPVRMKAERLLSWVEEISAYIRQHVDLPALHLPDLPLDPASAGAGADIERIADEVRSALRLGFGPLGNVIGALEEAGCIVSHCPMEPELGGSYSRFHAGNACIMLRIGEARSTWGRFHSAHELGHLVMHRHSSPGPFAESQADRFARAFLLPARIFAQEVWAPTIDALLTLKKDWRCPIQMMVSRAGEIGLFDSDQVRRASINLARRGWKATEPREESIPHELPQLLARAIRLLLDEHLKTPHSILTELSLNPRDVECFAGLPPGYFSDCEIPSPLELRLRASPLIAHNFFGSIRHTL